MALCIAVCFAASASSQCSVADPTPIPDNDFITLGFNVSGLTNANLASPLQGICGVEINFDHVYLGDLTITLISPAGTSVQLVGPTTNTTGYTHFTTWEISFVPCGTTANPDAGYSSTWSNDQVWNEFVTYSGSYYPANGCLEDFNVGSANGQWLIIVQDHDFLEIGNLLSLTLLFCDPAGLNCSECIPNAGVLSPASFDRCLGDHILSSEISVDFGNNIPSPQHYGYEYLLVSGNTILQHGISFSAALPAGTYNLCGFSYLWDDSTNVNALLAAGDLSGLQQDIISGTICGKVSNACIPVQINAPPDTVIIDSDLCQGEVFSFGGQDYATTGTFYQVHPGPGMCDSVFKIRIAPRILNVIINEPDTLFCNSPNVSLAAVAGGANGPFSYNWATSFGNITSSNTLPVITVDQAGPYTVSVSDGICSGVANTNVFADQGFPQIFVEGDTLTCNQTTVNLTPIYIPSNGGVQWSGPMGFSSNQPNIQVSAPGIYTLTITNAQGCSTSKEVMIQIDTATYPIGIYESARFCLAGSIQLSVATGLPIISYNWTGPNNFTSIDYATYITDAGPYTVVTTFDNGCTASDSFDFDGDFSIPDISVPIDDTLNCGETISLNASSTSMVAYYYWVLPNGSLVYQSTLQVQQEGTYIAYVFGINGCYNFDTVNIAPGPDVFPYQTFFDTIDCNHPNVDIGVVSAEADVFQWLNYSGPGGDQSTISVSAAGMYSVMLTDTNSHCELTASILVPANLTPPNFSYLLDTISCFDPVANLFFIPQGGQTYSKVYWQLPDLTTVQGPVLMTSSPGTYHLIAEGSNGCATDKSFEIPFDTLSPFLLVEGSIITCEDTATVEAQAVDSVINYNWSGPAILSNQENIIEVTHAGIYTLQATGVNGCITTVQVPVDSNYTLPVFTLIADTLRCDMPATISAITSDTILQYHWYDPGGLLIDTDSTIDVNQPGIYTFDIQGNNRCYAYDTITIDSPSYPVISITTDTFTCTDLTATLLSHIDVQPNAIIWLDTSLDTIGQSNSVVVTDDPGPFYLVVTGPNGCMTLDTTTVPYDSTAPHAIINVIGEIRCKERDIILDGSASNPSNPIFEWSTVGGNILSDPTLPMINANDTGFYQLIVTVPKNGCKDTADVQVLADPNEITSATFSVTQPRCHGEVNGSITLNSVIGGVEPFLYQLNGGPPQVELTFNQLIPGDYLFIINDAAGCQYDTLIHIPVTNFFTIDAGPDQEIYIGGTASLMGATDLIGSDIADEEWDSLGIDICHACPDLDVSPLETSTYTFMVSSITGCVLSDEVSVFVLEKGKYFIPNVFSPNGDGINDEVRIYPTPGIKKVLQWVIFDRWGNAVYGKTNFDPNDTSVFWDGRTTTGEFANPEVFPYVFEIQLINGNIELLHGNITLIR